MDIVDVRNKREISPRLPIIMTELNKLDRKELGRNIVFYCPLIKVVFFK